MNRKATKVRAQDAMDKKFNFSTRKISLYFDQVVKDRRDFCSVQSRWDEWARMRNKASKLSGPSFMTTMRALEALIEHALAEEGKSESKVEPTARTSAAAESLYEQVKEHESSAVKDF